MYSPHLPYFSKCGLYVIVKSTENGEKTMKEQLISKIQTVADNEKFKRDAFFLCGAATGSPNQGLLDACEKYLEAVKSGQPDKAEAETLIAQLEAVASTTAVKAGVNTVNNNIEYIKEILDNKEILLNK